MKTPCPCCGAETDTALPLVDLNSNTVAWRGRTIRVPGRVAEIVHVLVEIHPRFADADFLRARIWGPNNEVTIKNLSVALSKTRAAMKPLGFSIDTVMSRGWRIEPLASVTHKSIGLSSNRGRPRNA